MCIRRSDVLIRSFLGLAGYYRKFLRNFRAITKPLTCMLQKVALYVWTSQHDVAFQALKTALNIAPVLALPDFSLPFCVETDASGLGIGAVLMQKGHPLAYLSKALGPISQGLSTYEKEYFAILAAVEQWRHYLQHSEFHIYTNQKSLVQLSEHRLHTEWQKKVFTKLLGLNYKIVYKQGVHNKAADALSRRNAGNAECVLISSCTPTWLEEVVDTYAQDQQVQDVLTKLAVQSDAVPHFSLHNGLLKYKNRVWIGNVPAVKNKIMAVFHDSAVGGHSGVPVTYKRLKQLFAWQGMKKVVRTFVQECLIC